MSSEEIYHQTYKKRIKKKIKDSIKEAHCTAVSTLLKHAVCILKESFL